MQPDLNISSLALFVVTSLRQAGFEAYIVGGAVRDLLKQSTTPKMDYDFTTNALPEEILALFSDSFYENIFGTVSVSAEHLLEQMGVPTEQWHTFSLQKQKKSLNKLVDISLATKIHDSLLNEKSTPPEKNQGQEQPIKLGLPLFEITTFRSDGSYTDHRRPDQVEWGKSLEEDLERRDFTINAMALSFDADWLATLDLKSSSEISISASNYTIHDPHLGLSDLQSNILKTVGDPHRRFAEDALRMLRAVRFSVQLNCQITDNTFEAIKSHAQTLTAISQERIRDELLKILASPYPAEGIELLDETALLPHILPELLAMKGVKQGGHHTTDVWTHSVDALRECPSTDPIVRLATLLHDVGKPATQAITPKTITFYAHEIVGSRMAVKIAKRLRLSSKDTERVFTLVRYHMFHYQPHDTDAAIRRFMRKVGLLNLDDILDLREADRLGSNARRTSWRLEEMKQRMVEQLHQPMEVKDLAINGHDLMETFNLKPGKMLGQILQQLFDEVAENPELNSKESLLQKAKAILTDQGLTDQPAAQS